jgi:HEAT repeat protein
MNTHLENLIDRLHHPSNLSEQSIAIIREIAATGDPAAIGALADVMDTPGVVGREAAYAIYAAFGQLAYEPMKRLVQESLDEDQIRNAYRVLAALGDAYALRAVFAHCWADLDEEDRIATPLRACSR